MNLVRLGHYFSPTTTEVEEVAGSCQTSIVVAHVVDADADRVNLVVWTHDGADLRRQDVLVASPPVNGVASFHLSGDCPWGR